MQALRYLENRLLLSIGFSMFPIGFSMFYAPTRTLWRCVKKVVGRHVFVTFRLSGWRQVWRQVGVTLGAGLEAGRGQVWRQVGGRIGSRFEVNRAADFPFTKPRTLNPKVSRSPPPPLPPHPPAPTPNFIVYVLVGALAHAPPSLEEEWGARTQTHHQHIHQTLNPKP